MKDNLVSKTSFCFICVSLFCSSFLGMGFPYIIKHSGTSWFLSLLIGFVVSLVLLFIYFKIFNLLPEKNIVEKIKTIFPKVIGNILIYLLFLIFFLFSIIMFWRYSTFISSEFLTETPNFIIALLVSLPIIYAALLKFDVISRTSNIIILMCMSFYLLNFTSLFNSIDFTNFKPLFITPIKDTIKVGIISGVIQTAPIFITLIIPKSKITKNEKITRSILISYVVSFLAISGSIFSIIGVLGLNIANLYTFPSYIVLKTINVLTLGMSTPFSIIVVQTRMSYFLSMKSLTTASRPFSGIWPCA